MTKNTRRRKHEDHELTASVRHDRGKNSPEPPSPPGEERTVVALGEVRSERVVGSFAGGAPGASSRTRVSAFGTLFPSILPFRAAGRSWYRVAEVMSITDAVETHREELVDALLGVLAEGGDQAEVRQFVVGWYSLMAAAAAGDHGPRDEYLGSIVPPLRDQGFPFQKMVTGLVGMAAAVGAVLGPAHVGWVSTFFAEYAEELFKWWEQT